MDWWRPVGLCTIVIVLGLSGFAGPGATDPVRLAQAAQVPTPQAPQSNNPTQNQVVMPSAKQIVLLTRTALLTLNDAMRTGNFSVLHDVGAPGFREANPPKRLAEIFSSPGARRADLALVAIMVPEIGEAPILDQEAGLLRLVGSFPTRPLQIDFVLIFQSVAGQWRLFGISVDTSPASSAGQATGQATGAAPANVAAGQGGRPPLPKRNPGSVR